MRFKTAVLFTLFSFQFAFAQTPNPNVNRTPASDIASEVKLDVEKYRLPNGLTVLLYRDTTVPLISYHTWYRVGSRYETVGSTGLAHFFEHMSFKGTKRFPEGQYDRILQANGCRNNAFTTQDYTGYYVNLLSSKLELVMDLESDRMVNLAMTAANVQSELNVVKEERGRRVDNNPPGLLGEFLYATVFKISPYRWPVIGWPRDLDRLDLEKAQKFYHTYYAPNNAVLVIAGDFSISHAKHLIQKYYGAIPSQTIPPFQNITEPTQRAPREQRISRDVRTTLLELGYQMSAAGSDDSFAMDLIANILGRGPSSRLYKKLVYQKQVVTGVDAEAVELQNTGVFEISAEMKPGMGTVGTLATIQSELNRLRTEKVSDQELLKAKNQVMKDFVDSLKTLFGKAQMLAYSEVVLGDYQQLFTQMGKYSSVTPEMIQAVAQKYLGPSQRSLVILKPKN